MRRVHRWPILLPPDPENDKDTEKDSSDASLPSTSPETTLVSVHTSSRAYLSLQKPLTTSGVADFAARDSLSRVSKESPISRRSSVAETVLERLQNRDIQQTGSRQPHRSPRVLDIKEDAYGLPDPRRPSSIV